MARISKKEMKEKKEKYNQLVGLIESRTGKRLTGEEEGFLKWLCAWDMDTFNTFKGLLEKMRSRQLTLHERWAKDGLPNVTLPIKE